jgi:hypothetical protein
MKKTVACLQGRALVYKATGRVDGVSGSDCLPGMGISQCLPSVFAGQLKHQRVTAQQVTQRLARNDEL